MQGNYVVLYVKIAIRPLRANSIPNFTFILLMPFLLFLRLVNAQKLIRKQSTCFSFYH